MKKSKKIIAGLLISGILATSGALVGCGWQKPTEPLASTTDVYGFASATTGMLMSNSAVTSQVATMALLSNEQTFSTRSQLDEIKSNISKLITGTLNEYMNMFDSIVGGNKPVNVEGLVSDKQEYKNKLVISVNTIDGTQNTCVLYYNETLLDTPNIEVEDTDEEEKETQLVGELFLNGSETSLYVEGKKEIDPGDGEVEVTFEAKFNKDDDKNKVIFKQEREEKDGEIEEEYNFQIVVNGYSTEMSFSMERDAKGNIEVEYEHVIGDKVVSFEIEKISDTQLIIETRDFFGIELEINVTVKEGNDGEKQYVYSIPNLDIEIAEDIK